jgi:hypothetical protein
MNQLRYNLAAGGALRPPCVPQEAKLMVEVSLAYVTANQDPPMEQD